MFIDKIPVIPPEFRDAYQDESGDWVIDKLNDYYLTITESKKRFNRDGRHYFEKHKIFLYKEDFDKFTENLQEVIDFIKENAPEQDPIERENDGVNVEVTNENAELETVKAEGYSSDVDFDDLGETKE